ARAGQDLARRYRVAVVHVRVQDRHGEETLKVALLVDGAGLGPILDVVQDGLVKVHPADFHPPGPPCLGDAADGRVRVDVADGEGGVDIRVLQQVRAKRLRHSGRRAEGGPWQRQDRAFAAGAFDAINEARAERLDVGGTRERVDTDSVLVAGLAEVFT